MSDCVHETPDYVVVFRGVYSSVNIFLNLNSWGCFANPVKLLIPVKYSIITFWKPAKTKHISTSAAHTVHSRGQDDTLCVSLMKSDWRLWASRWEQVFRPQRGCAFERLCICAPYVRVSLEISRSGRRRGGRLWIYRITAAAYCSYSPGSLGRAASLGRVKRASWNRGAEHGPLTRIRSCCLRTWEHDAQAEVFYSAFWAMKYCTSQALSQAHEN